MIHVREVCCVHIPSRGNGSVFANLAFPRFCRIYLPRIVRIGCWCIDSFNPHTNPLKHNWDKNWRKQLPPWDCPQVKEEEQLRRPGTRELGAGAQRGYRPPTAAAALRTCGWSGERQKELEAGVLWLPLLWPDCQKQKEGGKRRNLFSQLLFFQLPIALQASYWQKLYANWQSSLGNVICRVPSPESPGRMKREVWSWKIYEYVY